MAAAVTRKAWAGSLSVRAGGFRGWLKKLGEVLVSVFYVEPAARPAMRMQVPMLGCTVQR